MHVMTGPFVCFDCRKSFKRPRELEAPPCPDCGGTTVGLSEKFQSPPCKDAAAWRVVQFIVERGFRYDTIHERTESGSCLWISHAYPRTMAEAREFVVKYRDHPTRVKS